MTKRQDVIKFFRKHGFWNTGGKKHDKYTNWKVSILIKRHSEIEDEIFEKLKREAGLK